MKIISRSSNGVSIKNITKTWWPLAISWLLMGFELPAISAIVARLDNPEINLAAYGGIVFPIAVIIESPIIMLLSASTALSRDQSSYDKLRRFMQAAGAFLTAVHLLIVVTPLYYFITEQIIGAPPEIIAPARTGLLIMLPWSWAIAYRRFNQGILIRFGYSKVIGIGTGIRLFTSLFILVVGYFVRVIPGIIIAASALTIGVIIEATYIGFRKHPVIKSELKFSQPIDHPLTYHAFFTFYVPLVMTSLLTFVVQPIGSAAISRMPRPLESLAVWPVISGLVFLMRSLGTAYNEVVISLISRPNSFINLKRFAYGLGLISTLLIVVLTVTDISDLWFIHFSGLSHTLAELAQISMWFTLLTPGFNVMQSWYQGALLDYGKTRGITEAVIIFICMISIVFYIGVTLNRFPGIYITMIAYGVGMAGQTFWLWLRSRPAFAEVKSRNKLQ